MQRLVSLEQSLSDILIQNCAAAGHTPPAGTVGVLYRRACDHLALARALLSRT
jgi:hypothetical protein